MNPNYKNRENVWFVLEHLRVVTAKVYKCVTNVFSVQFFLLIILPKNIKKTPYEILNVLPILPESTPQQSIRARIVFVARIINSQHLVDQIELF